MKIRSIIILLTVPLFLVMASVNGALLYFQQKAEMSRALGEQALAAAVVTAEFVAAMDAPQQELAKPLRRQAMDAASRQIVGLQAIYLVDADGAAMSLTTDSIDWTPQSYAPVTEGRIVRTGAGTDRSRFVAAFAPAGNRRFVAARLDAEPMFAQIEEIKRAILFIVLVSCIFSAGLSWFVARRIERELRINGQSLAAIAAGETVSNEDGLRIRETRDLADAVRLMGASQVATEMRDRRVIARNDRKRNLGEAVLRSRALLFKPFEREGAGTRIAMRICGDAQPGAFFALAASDDEASAVIGCCVAEDPFSALAQAAAARRFIEDNWIDMGAEKCLAIAREAYRIEELASIAWRSDEPLPQDTRLLCIADAHTAAAPKRYVSANPGAMPEEWLAAIELLLAPSGIFVAVGASGSADRNQSA
ncbi:hypothetical protein [uncultured Parasphingorhabdus sp.]|uniref:hypothetical protein n=1 Tax=uncultured Parasphingorhabdus sp. TaxID=2709694 RepID=UPI0030DC62F7|tara:strand:+ start:42907 stop:44169 length:1263 start_codon:yes stop_codon:yes gene_type:complete